MVWELRVARNTKLTVNLMAIQQDNSVTDGSNYKKISQREQIVLLSEYPVF